MKRFPRLRSASVPVRERALAAWFLTIGSLFALGQNPSAIEEFRSLKAELYASHKAGEWRANLLSANRLKRFLNAAPHALLEVARAEVHAGDLNAAFGEVEQFAGMGQSVDLAAVSADFGALMKDGRFARVQAAMKANGRAIARASTTFLLPDPDLLAEDMDYDARAQRFLLTSVREKKIVSVDRRGALSDFAKAPDDWPMLALKVDAVRGRLWATEVAMDGFSFAPKGDWGRSALLCYDLTSGQLLRRIEGPRGSALGDMTLTSNGEVVVSDGEGGGVYRLSAKDTVLERLDGGDFVSPQTAAMHPDGAHLFVPDYVRGIGVLDVASKQVRWLSMKGRFALNGIDGLYFEHGRLIAVQNGTDPERVVAFTLDASLTMIESETIIERSTSTLGDPTHGVVIDHDFYYIANSGWDAIDESGNRKPGSKASDARVMRAALATVLGS
jgi:sugar lactone lactonase YvrE